MTFLQMAETGIAAPLISNSLSSFDTRTNVLAQRVCEAVLLFRVSVASRSLSSPREAETNRDSEGRGICLNGKLLFVCRISIRPSELRHQRWEVTFVSTSAFALVG